MIRLALVTAVAFSLTAGTGQPPQSEASQALLALAAKYLTSYDRQFSAVVSEERYEQSGHGPKGVVTGHRLLRSDLLLVNSGEAGSLCFRDVYEVDGKAIRDRNQRLMDLFQHPTGDAIDQATKIREEGARFNIGTLSRTVNDPTMALAFLRDVNQRRSIFDLAGESTVNGVRTRVLRFREDSQPRLIGTPDESPASGRFWIDQGTGRIVRTELVLSAREARGTITVTYGPQEKLAGLWVPVRMEERYAVGSTQTIDCVATYSNFRQFNVTVR